MARQPVNEDMLKASLELFESRKKSFLVLSIVLFILFALFVAGGVVLMALSFSEKEFNPGLFIPGYFLVFFAFFFLIGAISLLVLRGTLIAHKIRNRQIALKAMNKTKKEDDIIDVK